MQEYYVLKKFEIFPAHPQGILFYTPEVSAHIKNEKLVALLKNIYYEKTVELNESSLDYLINRHQLPFSSVKEYLMTELKIISSLSAQRFNKLFIYSDDTFISEYLTQHFRQGYGLDVVITQELEALTTHSLLIVFQAKYHSEKVEKVYAACHQHHAWMVTAYLASHYLIIDNIFNSEKGVPCHFCNFYRHQHLVSSTNNLKKTSWINFSRRMLLEDKPVLPAMPFTSIEQGLITFWLARILKNYLDPHGINLLLNDMGKYHWINLLTGEMNQEQAVHWAFCQCLNEVYDERDRQ